MSLHERFRALGETGLFAELADPATLAAGCQRLRELGHDADELGPFLSVIASAGLGLPILRHGHSSLLDDAIRGRAVLAVAITEREAGSDVLAMRTRLTRGPGGCLRLSGAKWHVTNAPVADAFVVFAVDETTDDRFLCAVLVRPDDPGVRPGPPLDLIACKGSPTGEIAFDDVELTTDRVIGRPADGQRLLDLAFARERVLAPWPLLGKMERVIAECLDHVETRRQFGKALHEFQYVQEKIVSSFEEMLHARHLTERAVALVASGEAPGALASLAKAAAADAAAHTFRNAIEVFGSYGVQAERRYGEYLLDATCAQIAGGTRETHKKIVFGELRLDRARARSGRPSRLLRGERAGGDHG
jgi:isovaleryl-CoA dehydrogenase